MIKATTPHRELPMVAHPVDPLASGQPTAAVSAAENDVEALLLQVLRGGFHNYLGLICSDQRSRAAAPHICGSRQGQPHWISDFCTSSPRWLTIVPGPRPALGAPRRPRRSAW